MKALPASPSLLLLPEGKKETVFDNPVVIEFLERLMKEPYQIGEGYPDGEPAEIPAPIFLVMAGRVESEPRPFFVLNRHWMRVNNGQIEAVRHRVPINLNNHERGQSRDTE